MQIIKPSASLLWITPNAEKIIERAGRVCYKSEEKTTDDSYITFIRNIIKRDHTAVLEHASASFLLICDRGVLAELTRHRIASYAVESSRYVNYKEGITVIEPCFWNQIDNTTGELFFEDWQKHQKWQNAMLLAEQTYKELIELGAKPEEARSVLPNSLKTEIVMTANMREFRHILKLRTSKFAHVQIREIMNIVKNILKKECPIIFEDIE